MGCVYSKAWIGEFVPLRDVKLLESGEKSDQLYEFSSATDHEAGIARVSRVSAQFLPPDGSKVVKVPSGEYELHCSFLSQRGYYPDAIDKANQESFCIHTLFGTSPDDHFFGVFDGHGEFGAQCSQFVIQKLCDNMLRSSRFHTDAVEACHAAFLTTNSQLHADTVDDSMSGTTAVTILVRGRKLYVAKAGDSRAVVGEKRGDDVVAVDLSIDQTPLRPDELERVKLCGARVLTLDQIEGLKNPQVQCWGTEEDDDDGDPPRLWVQDGCIWSISRLGAVLRPSLPQVVEASGSESPSRMNWRSRNQRARHDISRALENSLENGKNWVPSSPSHIKTWEDEAQIEQALRDHFLFRKLSNSQCQVLLECMQRIEVGAGDIVVKQGGEGDCFFVVGDGEFEVLATQEEKDGNATTVLQRYTAEKISSFGELALMCNKPLQASVQAVTSGTLWALKREDFRGILTSEFYNLSSFSRSSCKADNLTAE